MESRKEIAEGKRGHGHNCAQAMVCTFSDLVEMDYDTLHHMTEAFGGGMANMEGTCGAIVGVQILLGLYNNIKGKKKPTPYYAKQVMEKFKERNGTTTCKELKGIGTGKVVRTCSECMYDACEFFEEIIQQM